MIEKIWESGYFNFIDDIMVYMISMVWHEGSVEKREDFEGTDIYEVRNRALNFIMGYYIDEQNKCFTKKQFHVEHKNPPMKIAGFLKNVL